MCRIEMKRICSMVWVKKGLWKIPAHMPVFTGFCYLATHSIMFSRSNYIFIDAQVIKIGEVSMYIFKILVINSKSDLNL